VTYCIHCSKHSVLANDFIIYARTSRMIREQLAALESALVGPKLTSKMSIRSLKRLSSGVVGVARPAICSAFDFRGFNLSPFACSYMLIARRFLVNVVLSVTNIDTSSEYVMTVVFRCRRPIFMPGSDSSKDRTNECRHIAYSHILSGHPRRMPLWMAIVHTRVPFTCTVSFIWSYMACSLSRKHGLIPYRPSTWIRHSCDIRLKYFWKSSDIMQSVVLFSHDKL
jgi:hypothetical protein